MWFIQTCWLFMFFFHIFWLKAPGIACGPRPSGLPVMNRPCTAAPAGGPMVDHGRFGATVDWKPQNLPAGNLTLFNDWAFSQWSSASLMIDNKNNLSSVGNVPSLSHHYRVVAFRENGGVIVPWCRSGWVMGINQLVGNIWWGIYDMVIWVIMLINIYGNMVYTVYLMMGNMSKSASRRKSWWCKNGYPKMVEGPSHWHGESQNRCRGWLKPFTCFFLPPANGSVDAEKNTMCRSCS